MGIQGLIPFLKDATQPINIRKYQGYAVAIDTYCWIHRGAFGCALQLAKGEKTDIYVKYCLKFVNMLRSMDIKPVLVFDGRHLPSKKLVEKSRRERRELYSKKGKQLLREGKASEARDCFTKCINVTPEMALEVMKAVRSLGVDCIVAPYEADAQLAYLEKSGIVQAVITEDSDLVAFGCKKVIVKMDTSGNGLEIDQTKLNQAMKIGDKFSLDKFRYMCILSGCDYLPSLPGIGLGKARKLFQISTNPDLNHVLKRMAFNLKMKIKVPQEYIDGFFQANNTFLYQLAYDPLQKRLVPLNPYPPDLDKESLEYAGSYTPTRDALQVALGNIDINTNQVIFNFKPDTRKVYPPKTPCHLMSIWHVNFKPLQLGEQAGNLNDIERQSTYSKEIIVNANVLPKKISPGMKRAREEEKDVLNLSDSEMALMYGAEMASSTGTIPESPTKIQKVQEGQSGIKKIQKRNRFAINKSQENSPREIVHSRFFPQKVVVQKPPEHEEEANKVSPTSRTIHPKTASDVRSETPRIYNENMDRTKVLDKLERFQRIKETPTLSDAKMNVGDCDIQENSAVMEDCVSSQSSHSLPDPLPLVKEENKTPGFSSKRNVKKGAFSWSKQKKNKNTGGIQKSLSDSMKSLSAFRHNSTSSKLLWKPSAAQALMSSSGDQSVLSDDPKGESDGDSTTQSQSQNTNFSSQFSTNSQNERQGNISENEKTDSTLVLHCKEKDSCSQSSTDDFPPVSLEDNSYGTYSCDPLWGEDLYPSDPQEANENLTPDLPSLRDSWNSVKRRGSDTEYTEQRIGDSDPVFVVEDKAEDTSSHHTESFQESGPNINGTKRSKITEVIESDENLPPSQPSFQRSCSSLEGISAYFSEGSNTSTPSQTKGASKPKMLGGLSKPCKASGLIKRKSKSPKTSNLSPGQCTLMSFMKKKPTNRISTDRLPLSPSKFDNCQKNVFVSS